MFGLAILFVLFLWLILTLLATYCGYKIAHKYNHGKLGAFIGFMLLMGGWLVYWTVEYFYIQAKVKHLCETQGGVTVYVTPEEWRKMIGEEEWSRLRAFTDKEILYRYNLAKNNTFIFDGKTYNISQGRFRAGNIENEIVSYYHYVGKIDNIPVFSKILVNTNHSQVLIKSDYFLYKLKIHSFKTWLNTDGCSTLVNHKFHNIALQYSNN